MQKVHNDFFCIWCVFFYLQHLLVLFFKVNAKHLSSCCLDFRAAECVFVCFQDLWLLMHNSPTPSSSWESSSDRWGMESLATDKMLIPFSQKSLLPHSGGLGPPGVISISPLARHPLPSASLSWTHAANTEGNVGKFLGKDTNTHRCMHAHRHTHAGASVQTQSRLYLTSAVSRGRRLQEAG